MRRSESPFAARLDPIARRDAWILAAVRGRYRAIGGELRVGCPVIMVGGHEGAYELTTRRGAVAARQIVCAVPAGLAARLGPPQVAQALHPYLRRDATAEGGAIAIFLGVPDREVDNQTFTHHQLMYDYDRPLGVGNNMFISVSAPGDLESAPAGHRAVMISTHCELAPWEGLAPEVYLTRKREIGDRLIALARRCIPGWAATHLFTRLRPRGHMKGTLADPRGRRGCPPNSRECEPARDPTRSGIPGYWLAGDTTWPGLGTVAGCLGSRLVAEGVISRAGRYRSVPAKATASVGGAVRVHCNSF